MDAFDASCLAVDRPLARRGSDTGAFWRKEDPILTPATDHTGAVIRDDEGRAKMRVATGGLFPHQRDWWDLPNFVKGMIGGYGSGKTLAGAKKIISLALANARPGSAVPVAAVSPTYPMAMDTIVATIKELLAGKQQLYGREFWWRYNSTSKKFFIRFRGRDAQIFVYSGDNPDRLKGPNLAAAWLDEPFLMDRAVFDQIIARVRHPLAVVSEIILTGTPEQLNWGYDLFVGDDEEFQDVGMIQASTRGNLALDPKYIRRLESALTEEAAEAYIEGGFVNLTKGMVYYGFNPNENMREIEVPEGALLGVGMDFNVNPMSAVVFWENRGHMHFIDEYEMPNADTEYLCGQLREDYGERIETVYPDASGRARATNAPGGLSDFDIIERFGFEVDAPNANPRRKDRYNAVNGKLKNRAGEVSITIDPKCKKLRKYLQVYSHEIMHKQEAYSHLLDAFSYPVSTLFGEHVMRATTTQLVGY